MSGDGGIRWCCRASLRFIRRSKHQCQIKMAWRICLQWNQKLECRGQRRLYDNSKNRKTRTGNIFLDAINLLGVGLKTCPNKNTSNNALAVHIACLNSRGDAARRHWAKIATIATKMFLGRAALLKYIDARAGREHMSQACAKHGRNIAGHQQLNARFGKWRKTERTFVSRFRIQADMNNRRRNKQMYGTDTEPSRCAKGGTTADSDASQNKFQTKAIVKTSVNPIQHQINLNRQQQLERKSAVGVFAN